MKLYYPEAKNAKNLHLLGNEVIVNVSETGHFDVNDEATIIALKAEYPDSIFKPGDKGYVEYVPNRLPNSKIQKAQDQLDYVKLNGEYEEFKKKSSEEIEKVKKENEKLVQANNDLKKENEKLVQALDGLKKEGTKDNQSKDSKNTK